MIIIKLVSMVRCNQCGSEWDSRVKEGVPLACPRCKRYDWDEPKKSRVHINTHGLGRKKGGNGPMGTKPLMADVIPVRVSELVNMVNQFPDLATPVADTYGGIARVSELPVKSKVSTGAGVVNPTLDKWIAEDRCPHRAGSICDDCKKLIAAYQKQRGGR